MKVVPVRAELTNQEAADLLNVSHYYLVRLLETGKLPFHKTGRHRRIRFNDLMAYKQLREERGTQVMESLAVDAQELKIGYEVKRP